MQVRYFTHYTNANPDGDGAEFGMDADDFNPDTVDNDDAGMLRYKAQYLVTMVTHHRHRIVS